MEMVKEGRIINLIIVGTSIGEYPVSLGLGVSSLRGVSIVIHLLTVSTIARNCRRRTMLAGTTAIQTHKPIVNETVTKEYYVLCIYGNCLFVHMLNLNFNCLPYLAVKEAVNRNSEQIVTPVSYEKLNDLLIEVGYNEQKRKFLVDGFKYGFSLQYQGPLKDCQRTASNLKLRVGSKLELWNKVMNEVELGRYAGPYEEPPFEAFVQSPIGLVPKDKGLKTRLIFHLSYPREGDSVNSGIPHEKCTVKYPEFDEAVEICLKEGRNCKIGKSDMSSAFRHVLMAKD